MHLPCPGIPLLHRCQGLRHSSLRIRYTDVSACRQLGPIGVGDPHRVLLCSAASAGTVGAAAPAYALPDRMLTRREEHDLLRMVHAAAPQDTAAATAPTAEQRRARRAKRILVTFLTVPLLHSATVIARRSQGLVTAAELVDDGHKGLQRAIDRFDASRGNASSLRTFATAHVRGEMRSCVRNKAVAMGTPRTVQAVRARVRATAARRRKESPERDLSAQEESVRAPCQLCFA